MEFRFLNSKFDLSTINAGISIDNDNELLKKYDLNNNSIFDAEELSKLKEDLRPYTEDGILDEKESISFFAQLMNLTTSAVESLFTDKNLVAESLEKLFYEEHAKNEAIQRNLSEINTAIDIYHDAVGGYVSQFCNSIKEIFNTEYAGDKVYRQLAKSKASAMLVEKSEQENLLTKEYAQTKIDLLEFLLNIDELPEKEQKEKKR